MAAASCRHLCATCTDAGLTRSSCMDEQPGCHHWSRKRARRWPPRSASAPPRRTTSTNGHGTATRSSCSPSHRWRVMIGGRRRGYPADEDGLRRWRSPDLLEGRYADCPNGSPSCWTTGQHAHAMAPSTSAFAPAPGSGTGSSSSTVLTTTSSSNGSCAEHRRERTEFDDAPMPGRAPHRRPRDRIARRSVGVVHRRRTAPNAVVDWQMQVRRCAP